MQRKYRAAGDDFVSFPDAMQLVHSVLIREIFPITSHQVTHSSEGLHHETSIHIFTPRLLLILFDFEQ